MYAFVFAEFDLFSRFFDKRRVLIQVLTRHLLGLKGLLVGEEQLLVLVEYEVVEVLHDSLFGVDHHIGSHLLFLVVLTALGA